jgi:hypothetical protein
MRDYAVSDYGLLLDEETIKVIASKLFDDFSENEKEDWAYLLYDNGICEYISDFTGEALPIREDGYVSWYDDGENYRCETIAFIPTSNFPTLFKKAYENIDEIIDEFKQKVGEYLPDGFDHRGKLRHISGTYFG